MQESNLQQLEKKLGTVFKNSHHLRLALIHRSYLNEHPEEKESNERLEFLGDAVLEFIVSDILFGQFPKEDEGHLTVLRSRLVNTNSLAGTAKDLEVGELLFLSRGEEKSGGRTNTGLLADTIEAILGAIFIDQGLEPARSFVKTFIASKVPEIVKKSLKDPKSLLQEFVQANGYPAPIYKTVSQLGPDHAKIFTVHVLIDKKPYAHGVGASKQLAAQDAAQQALNKWTQVEN